VILETHRLVLRAADVELARAELAGADTFASALDATVPPGWPPPLNDESSMRWILEMLEEDPGCEGWVAWYFLQRNDDGSFTAIGTGGFKGRPDADGTAEIGYSVMETHQRRGIAPEAVAALVTWAFSHPGVTRIVAHTLPDDRASIRVLEKNDFTFVGPGLEEGAILFERRRR
jgi:RimJ/RimL family protein N-acetyltransferase